MKQILFLFILCLSLISSGQTPVFEWANQIGGLSYESINSIATDSMGNIYTTGTFKDTVDFDPNSGIYNLIAKGESLDIFVAKYSPNGTLIWATRFGSFDGDVGEEITTDSAGNVYITGVFEGTVDFDPSNSTQYLTADFENIFILKLDTEGSFLWARNMGGEDSDIGLGIIVDESGNVYTTGSFMNVVDFDPGLGIYNLSVGNAFFTAFISKLNSEGDFVWAIPIGEEGSASGIAITLDSDNNVYLTGGFNGIVDFDPGPDQFNLSTEGANDIFISKLNSSGNFIWAKSIGSSLNDVGRDITVDENDNVYVTGFFEGSADFDSGSGQFVLSSSGGLDAFLLKLDVNGNFSWANAIGATGIDLGNAVTVGQNNNIIYATGYFEETVDFDFGPDSLNISAGGEERNAYLLKLDSTGSFLWAGSFSGNEYITGCELTLDKWDNIYTVGDFFYTADFDPDSTSYELASNGSSDIFIQKMRQLPCTANPTIISSTNTSFSICPGEQINLRAELPTDVVGFSYSWSSGEDSDSILVAPDSTSTYMVSVNYSPSCNDTASVEVTVFDSVAISFSGDLEVCVQEEVSLEASGGVSYFWSTGDTTSLMTDLSDADQTYSVTVTDVNGCMGVDSIAVLIVLPSDTTYMDIGSCDSLAVGVVSFTYSDQYGCDSIVIETTTLIPIPETPTAPADLVIQENAPAFQLTIPEVPNATSYSWQVPTGVQILSGANTNTITIDWDDQVINGSVCVSALNECGSSPADCMEITVDIIDAVKNIKNKDYSIFPNPTDAFLNIVFDNGEVYEIVLLDLLGRTVIPPLPYSGQAKIETKELASGTYWVKISKGGETFWERVEVLR